MNIGNYPMGVLGGQNGPNSGLKTPENGFTGGFTGLNNTPWVDNTNTTMSNTIPITTNNNSNNINNTMVNNISNSIPKYSADKKGRCKSAHVDNRVKFTVQNKDEINKINVITDICNGEIIRKEMNNEQLLIDSKDEMNKIMKNNRSSNKYDIINAHKKYNLELKKCRSLENMITNKFIKNTKDNDNINNWCMNETRDFFIDNKTNNNNNNTNYNYDNNDNNNTKKITHYNYYKKMKEEEEEENEINVIVKINFPDSGSGTPSGTPKTRARSNSAGKVRVSYANNGGIRSRRNFKDSVNSIDFSRNSSNTGNNSPNNGFFSNNISPAESNDCDALFNTTHITVTNANSNGINIFTPSITSSNVSSGFSNGLSSGTSNGLSNNLPNNTSLPRRNSLKKSKNGSLLSFPTIDNIDTDIMYNENAKNSTKHNTTHNSENIIKIDNKSDFEKQSKNHSKNVEYASIERNIRIYNVELDENIIRTSFASFLPHSFPFTELINNLKADLEIDGKISEKTGLQSEMHSALDEDLGSQYLTSTLPILPLLPILPASPTTTSTPTTTNTTILGITNSGPATASTIPTTNTASTNRTHSNISPLSLPIGSIGGIVGGGSPTHSSAHPSTQASAATSMFCIPALSNPVLSRQVSIGHTTSAFTPRDSECRSFYIARAR